MRAGITVHPSRCVGGGIVVTPPGGGGGGGGAAVISGTAFPGVEEITESDYIAAAPELSEP